MEQLKQQIGEQLGIGLRSVNRYLCLLEAIIDVQQAFESGRISLVDAGKVALMRQPDQRTIVERINNGEPAKAVLEEYLRKRDGNSDGVGGAFDTFVKALGRGWRLLNGRVPEIRYGRLATADTTLEAASELIHEMLAQVKENERRNDEEDAA